MMCCRVSPDAPKDKNKFSSWLSSFVITQAVSIMEQSSSTVLCRQHEETPAMRQKD
jgi:hypothetical protein